MTQNPVSGMSSQGWTGNSETARTRLEALGLGHEPDHGLVVGPHALGRHQHGRACEEGDGLHLPPHGPQEERRRLRAGVVEVDVGVGVVADERVGLLDHPGRDRRVEV
jgi:hypothetical protein